MRWVDFLVNRIGLSDEHSGLGPSFAAPFLGEFYKSKPLLLWVCTSVK